MKNKMKLLLMVSILPISVFAAEQKSLSLEEMIDVSINLRSEKDNKVIPTPSRLSSSENIYELSDASYCTLKMVGYIKQLSEKNNLSLSEQRFKDKIARIYSKTGTKVKIKLSELEQFDVERREAFTSFQIGSESNFTSLGHCHNDNDFFIARLSNEATKVEASLNKQIKTDAEELKKLDEINESLTWLDKVNKPNQDSVEANKSSTPLHDNKESVSKMSQHSVSRIYGENIPERQSFLDSSEGLK